jgi:hypothetical protein
MGALNSKLLASVIESIDGVPVIQMAKTPDVVAKELSIPSRRSVIEALVEAQPGPDWREAVKTPCSNCAQELEVTLDLASLLLL